MLDFIPLTADTFYEFEQDILASEAIFPENIRESSEGYLEALQKENSLGLVARFQNRYVGNVVGFQPCTEACKELRLHEVHNDVDDLVYLFNIVTLPEFQNQGFGKKLLRAFLDTVKDAGFRKVGGHFRGNGSLKNFKVLGGKEMACFDNWFDTGESYTYCVICMEEESTQAY